MALLQRCRFVPIFLLALICYLGFFHGLGSYGLWDPDEGRSGVIARDGLASGNWATLTFDGEPYYDKPALFFWLVALGFKLLGSNELAVRLPSAVAATLTIGFVLWYGVASGGWRRGLWGAAVLATSMEFCFLGRLGKMDMVFGFFFTAALLSFLWWLRRSQGRGWIYLFYGFLALAALTKGPVGIVLPFLIVGSYLALEKKWDILREMRWISGALLMLLIAGPWYLTAFFQDPQYMKTFLWDHNVLRYLTTEPGIKHAEPIYYFLPILFAGFLPWSFYLPAMAYHLGEKSDEPRREEILFLSTWVITVLIFFSLSRNKLAVYILPAFPPLALLTGEFLRHSLEVREAKPWLRLWTLGASLVWLSLLLVASPLSDLLLSYRYLEYPRLDLPTLPAAFLILTTALAWLLGRRSWIPWIVSFSSLWLILWFYGEKAKGISELRGTKSLAQMVIRHAPSDARIVAINGESFGFYIPAPVQLASHPGQVEEMLREPVPTVALIKEKHIGEIQPEDPRRFFVWKTIPPRNALVANFPMSSAQDLGKVPNP